MTLVALHLIIEANYAAETSMAIQNSGAAQILKNF